jgi:hypothetical protein
MTLGNSTTGNATIRMADNEFRIATGTNDTFGVGIKDGNIRTEGDINMNRYKNFNIGGTASGSRIYDDNDLRIASDNSIWFRTNNTDRVEIHNDYVRMNPRLFLYNDMGLVGNSTTGNAYIRMTDGEFKITTGTDGFGTFGFGIKDGNIRTDGDINMRNNKNFNIGPFSKIYDDNDLRIETDDRLLFRTGGTDRVQINNDNMILTRPINIRTDAAMSYKSTPANSFQLGFLNGRPAIEWNDGSTTRVLTFWSAGNNKALFYEDP